jgi:hypothetical protein
LNKKLECEKMNQNNQNKTVGYLIAETTNPIKQGDLIGSSINRGGINSKHKNTHGIHGINRILSRG